MPKIKEGYRIAYDIYQTPGSAEEEPTYHVRRISMTINRLFDEGQTTVFPIHSPLQVTVPSAESPGT